MTRRAKSGRPWRKASQEPGALNADQPDPEDDDELQEDEANIFAALDDPTYREVRRIIIATVLHTAGRCKQKVFESRVESATLVAALEAEI